MLIRAIAISRVTAFLRLLVASRVRRTLLASLLTLASLFVSSPAAATPHPAATPVTITRNAPSAECHVYVITLRVPHDRANARRLGAPGARSAASTTGRAVLVILGAGINSTDISGLLKGVPDWLVWLDDHGVLQSAGDFSAGVSSALTFGLSDKLIGATGLGKYGSKCSGAFSAGKYSGMAVGLVGGSLAAFGKAAVVEGAEAATSVLPRVFWSGGDGAMNAAASYAEATGQTTLEMTAAGRALTAKAGSLAWSEAKPLWNAASAEFAKDARGVVDVFIARTPSPQSVWSTVEKGLLQANEAVTGLRYHLAVLP